MDPETQRVKTTDVAAAGGELAGHGAGHWRGRARWTAGLSPHHVVAVDLDDARFQWACGARFGSSFVVTESAWGATADDAAWTRCRDAISGRTVHVSIPEALVIRRLLRLPTRDPREIETMLGYQLGPTLPVDLDELQWSWRAVDARDGGTTVVVELCRHDALAQHVAPLVDAGARVERAIPEAWSLAHRIRDLTGDDESAGLFLRSDGALLVVQERGRLVFAARVTSCGLVASDVESPKRRATQKALDRALEPARHTFSAHFGRGLPALTVVVDSAPEDRGHELEVVVANALGAEPAGTRWTQESLPWRAPALAALASITGPSLRVDDAPTKHRGRRLAAHALFLLLALVGALGYAAHAELRDLESARDGLGARLANRVEASSDLASMQRAMQEDARRRQGSHEPILALLAVHRHSTNDFVIDRLTYLAGETIEIIGSARDVPSVVGFARKLEGEGLFASTTVRDLSETVGDDATRVRFALEGRLQP